MGSSKTATAPFHSESVRRVMVTEEKLMFADLAHVLVDDYEANRKRSVDSVRLSLQHLSEYFGDTRLLDISGDRVTSYVVDRQRQGAANASINRELAALARGFTLMMRAGRLSSRPHIAQLREDNARQGFVDPADFDRLRRALPAYLQDPIHFLYLSAWRVGEMRSLQWGQVAGDDSEIRLLPEQSKNRRARVIPMTGELKAIVSRARDQRRLDCPHVFHIAGKQIGEFKKTWRSACRAAGLNKVLVHDLRRSGVRNMIRAGISEHTAMMISGHQTASTFRRYITSLAPRI